MNESHLRYFTHDIWMSHIWGISHVWMSYVKDPRTEWMASIIVCEELIILRMSHIWDMSFVWMSHVKDLRTDLRLAQWFTWLIHLCDMSHVNACMNESCHTYEWVTGHIWTIYRFVPLRLQLQLCDVTTSYVWRGSFVCVTWLIHMCDMAHLYVRHDSFICVTWLIRMCDMTHSYVHSYASYVTWLIHSLWRNLFCATWLFYSVTRDSFICVTRLIHLCDMAHSFCVICPDNSVWHVTFIRVTRLIYYHDMTHSSVWHGSFILCKMTHSLFVTRLICSRSMTRSYVLCDTRRTQM